jgi:hypothetical protein
VLISCVSLPFDPQKNEFLGNVGVTRRIYIYKTSFGVFMPKLLTRITGLNSQHVCASAYISSLHRLIVLSLALFITLEPAATGIASGFVLTRNLASTQPFSRSDFLEQTLAPTVVVERGNSLAVSLSSRFQKMMFRLGRRPRTLGTSALEEPLYPQCLHGAALTFDTFPEFMTGVWGIHAGDSNFNTTVDVKPMTNRPGWLVLWRVDPTITVTYVMSPDKPTVQALRELRDAVQTRLMIEHHYRNMGNHAAWISIYHWSEQKGIDAYLGTSGWARTQEEPAFRKPQRTIWNIWREHFFGRKFSVAVGPLAADSQNAWTLVNASTPEEAVRRAAEHNETMRQSLFNGPKLRSEIRFIDSSGVWVAADKLLTADEIVRPVVVRNDAKEDLSLSEGDSGSEDIRPEHRAYNPYPTIESSFASSRFHDVSLNGVGQNIRLRFTSEDWSLIAQSMPSLFPNSISISDLDSNLSRHLDVLSGRTLVIKIVSGSPKLFGAAPVAGVDGYINAELLHLRQLSHYNSDPNSAIANAWFDSALASIALSAADRQVGSSGRPSFDPVAYVEAEATRQKIRKSAQLNLMSPLAKRLEISPQRLGLDFLAKRGLQEKFQKAPTLKEALRITTGAKEEEIISLATLYFEERYDIDLEILTDTKTLPARFHQPGNPLRPVAPETARAKIIERLVQWDNGMQSYAPSVARINPLFRRLVVVQSGRGLHDSSDGVVLLALDDNDPEGVSRHELGHALDPRSLLKALEKGPYRMRAMNGNFLSSVSVADIERFVHRAGGTKIYNVKNWDGNRDYQTQLKSIASLIQQMYEARRRVWIMLNHSGEYHVRKDHGNRLSGQWEGLLHDLEEELSLLSKSPYVMDQKRLYLLQYEYRRAIQSTKKGLASGRLPSGDHRGIAAVEQFRLELNSKFRATLNPENSRNKGLSQIYIYEVPKNDDYPVLSSADTNVRLRLRSNEWWAEQIKLFMTNPRKLRAMDREAYELLTILMDGVIVGKPSKGAKASRIQWHRGNPGVAPISEEVGKNAATKDHGPNGDQIETSPAPITAPAPKSSMREFFRRRPGTILPSLRAA